MTNDLSRLVTFRASPELAERLREAAHDLAVPVSTFARMALTQTLREADAKRQPGATR